MAKPTNKNAATPAPAKAGFKNGDRVVTESGPGSIYEVSADGTLANVTLDEENHRGEKNIYCQSEDLQREKKTAAKK
jgi:hypothetical protein